MIATFLALALTQFPSQAPTAPDPSAASAGWTYSGSYPVYYHVYQPWKWVPEYSVRYHKEMSGPSVTNGPTIPLAGMVQQLQQMPGLSQVPGFSPMQGLQQAPTFSPMLDGWLKGLQQFQQQQFVPPVMQYAPQFPGDFNSVPQIDQLVPAWGRIETELPTLESLRRKYLKGILTCAKS